MITRHHWRALIAINVIVIVVSAAVKSTDVGSTPYAHLLIDYHHFGFVKRALVGEIVSLFMDKVPPSMVLWLGGSAIALTITLYVKLFKDTFGFSEASLPLFVFTAGSPFFIKNFVKTIGYFDIYGCILALIMLLIPARSMVYIAFGLTGSILLVLTHQIHMLLYIPTIAAIAIIRRFLIHSATRTEAAVSAALAMSVPAIFLYMQFAGGIHDTQAQFDAYLLSRTADTMATSEDFSSHYWMWTGTMSGEMARTWSVMDLNLSRFWYYALLIALHAPLIGFFRASIHAINSPNHRRIVLAMLVAITLGYGIIFATVFDYARWVAAWGVCMILMLHAVRQLPGAAGAPLIAADNNRNFALASILTLIPRIGITRPF